MNKAKKWIIDNKLIVGIILATLFVAFLPLFSFNCINGHDIEYHLLRIEALKEGILSGLPFLRINMLYFGGRGYASSLFYPDFLLYIPALLRCIGVSINSSYHIFVAVCILLSFATMYYSVNTIACDNGFDGGDIALMAAVIYTLSQYHLDDIYTRSAVGEYTAMIFIPFLIYGLYDLMMGKMKRPWIMFLGFSGTLLCHTNTTVFAIGIYVIAFIVSLPALINNFKSKERRDNHSFPAIIILILTAIAVLLFTACYWLPVLEQFACGKFQTGAGGFDLDYEKLLIKDVFANVNPSLGLVIPVMCLARLIIDKKDKNEAAIISFADICLVFGILFTLGTTGLVPWKRLQNIVGFIQFPWRFFIIATPMLSVAAAIYLGIAARCAVKETDGKDDGREKTGELNKSLRALMLFVTALMITSAICNISRINEGYYSYSDDYYSYTPFTGNVIGGEWLPEAAADRDALVEDCDKATFNDGSSQEVVRIKNKLTLKAIAGREYVDVPFIYYKGYEAINEKGEKLLVTGEGENGSARVYLGGADGNITVYYAGTFIQHLATAISLIFTIILLATLIFKKKQLVK